MSSLHVPAGTRLVRSRDHSPQTIDDRWFLGGRPRRSRLSRGAVQRCMILGPVVHAITPNERIVEEPRGSAVDSMRTRMGGQRRRRAIRPGAVGCAHVERPMLHLLRRQLPPLAIVAMVAACSPAPARLVTTLGIGSSRITATVTDATGWISTLIAVRSASPTLGR
ncbi:MAG: hypothetical protein WCK58_18540 [Chloroflexota bacterium]